VNPDVTVGAISVLRVQVMLRTGRLNCADLMGDGVTCQTKLSHAAGCQHPRIGRAVRRMTRDTPFSLHRGVFESEWTLFVRMTLNTGRVDSGRQSGLLEFKTAMWIVAITALHSTFENLVMKRQIELVLYFGVATQAKLRFGVPQQLDDREARLLSVRFGDENVGTGYVPPGYG